MCCVSRSTPRRRKSHDQSWSIHVHSKTVETSLSSKPRLGPSPSTHNCLGFRSVGEPPPARALKSIFLPQSKSHTVRLKSNESVARYIVGAVRGAKFYRALGLPQALFWDSELRSPTSGKANGLLTEFRKTQVPSRQFDLLPPFFHISFHFAFCSTGGLESWSSRPGDVPLCPELSAPSFSEDRHKSSALFWRSPHFFPSRNIP